ncbi:hypothetical protein LCGC14_0021740 [marine sediment metagenome]|uniref:Uncharacterized protein n=1 Tax=marine sediment metagenome TaxID=412755 RepID=A0A0F9W089_9ZZZZ
MSCYSLIISGLGLAYDKEKINYVGMVCEIGLATLVLRTVW